MPSIALRPLAFGEVLDQAFGLYRTLFPSLFIVSLLSSGIPSLLMIVSNTQGGVIGAPVLWGSALLLSVVGGAIATASSTYLVSGYLLGRPLSTGEALSRALPKIWPLIACSLAFGLVVGLGFLLLIVPGVIAAAGLILAFTALTVEDLTAPGALGRSWELTKGYKGKIFGLLFVFGIILYIIMIGIGVVLGIGFALVGRGSMEAVTPGGPLPPFFIALSVATSVLQIVAYPLLYCVLVTAYYDLRVRKEGFDLELLATTMEQPARR